MVLVVVYVDVVIGFGVVGFCGVVLDYVGV